MIGVAALISDLAGYFNFTQYWFASWGKVLAVVFWAVVFFYFIKGGKTAARAQAPGDEGESVSTARTVSRLTLWIALAVWLLAALALFLAAWGFSEKAWFVLFRILDYSVSLGSVRISPLSITYAGVILWLTHAVAGLLANAFKNKVLADSDLEPGFRESVTTLLEYAIWAFGIVLAFHTLGVSGASLTVIFGALGIGLGFGLQNIFNNFISGLILLFERPVQVGDILELDGTWGEVRKINVRSTIVQTYDNASLIIPNSEIISKQVTNWSFKDPKVRRKIIVGVAYGSDVELVRKILQETADASPRVYKRPKPDVLFKDFGDSALIFTLRFWAHIDIFLSVETELRFEIDRAFRENGVQIPFPQRDLHIIDSV